MTTKNVIKHRTDTIYEDYLALCQGNHCQALILGLLEHYHEKISSGEHSIFVPLTYGDFMQATYNLYGRNSIINALNKLEQDGFIEKHPFEIMNNSTYAYRLNIPVLQQRLYALPEKTSFQQLQGKSRSKPAISSNKIISLQALRAQNDLLSLFHGNCAYCQQHDATTWDHIIPIEIIETAQQRVGVGE